MLTKTQFMFMLFISMLGTVFAYALPDLVDWYLSSEIGSLLFAVFLLVGYMAWVGYDNHVNQEKIREAEHEERVERVRQFLQDHIDKKKELLQKKKVDVE